MRKAVEMKKKKVEELKKIMESYPVIGILDLRNLPSKQFHEIKKKLSDHAKIIVSKKVVILKALEGLKDKYKGIEKLESYVKDIIPAVIVSDLDAFKLMKKIRENLSPAPAKAGQIAPEDIVVKKGPTPFAPGPMLSEFGKIGVKAKVENQKIVVLKDTVVTKKGEEVTEEVASMLLKLGIQPMKIGLNLLAAYEGGVVFDKDVLTINEEEYINKIETAYRHAFNLAMNVGILTKETVEHIIQKAFIDAKALAVECNIVSKEVMDLILAKAEGQASAIHKMIQGG